MRRVLPILALCLLLAVAAGGLCFYQEPGWVLVWSDDFDGAGLPCSRAWTFETRGNEWGWGNDEAQYYTDSRLENARVEDGRLVITARKEPAGGRDYTSARINNRKTGGWLYGRFEARMKLPSGRGIWPAFWMMPVDNYYGVWPGGGEIDIMEFFGFIPGTVHCTIHTHAYNHGQGTHKGAQVKVPDLHAGYHLYAVEWFDDRLDFYLDGRKVFTYSKEGDDPGVWPFNKHFYIILNCAVGGEWCYRMGGIGDTPFPQELLIDYVRVYQWNDGKPHTLVVNTTGGGRVVYEKKKNYAPGEQVTLRADAEPGYKFLYWSGDLSSVRKKETTFAVFRDTAVTAHFVPVKEKVQNGGFDLGLFLWNFWVDTPPAAAKPSIDRGALRVDVTRPGKEDWQVQVSQPLALHKNKTYTVTFDAWAGRRKKIRVRLNQNHPPYAAYASRVFTVEKKEETYSFTVTMAEESDHESRLEFDFGPGRGTVWLDNISMIEEEEEEGSSGE